MSGDESGGRSRVPPPWFEEEVDATGRWTDETGQVWRAATEPELRSLAGDGVAALVWLIREQGWVHAATHVPGLDALVEEVAPRGPWDLREKPTALLGIVLTRLGAPGLPRGRPVSGQEIQDCAHRWLEEERLSRQERERREKALHLSATTLAGLLLRHGRLPESVREEAGIPGITYDAEHVEGVAAAAVEWLGEGPRLVQDGDTREEVEREMDTAVLMLANLLVRLGAAPRLVDAQRFQPTPAFLPHLQAWNIAARAWLRREEVTEDAAVRTAQVTACRRLERAVRTEDMAGILDALSALDVLRAGGSACPECGGEGRVESYGARGTCQTGPGVVDCGLDASPADPSSRHLPPAGASAADTPVHGKEPCVRCRGIGVLPRSP